MGNVYSENRVCKCPFPTEKPLEIPDKVKSNSRNVRTKGSKKLFSEEDVSKLSDSQSCKNDLVLSTKGTSDRAQNDNKTNLQHSRSESDCSPNGSSLDTSFVLSDLTDKISKLSTKSVPSSKENLDESADGEIEGEVISPKYYYGWFFSPETSSSINTVVKHFYRLGLKEVSPFHKFIINCDEDGSTRDPLEYYRYKRPGKRIRPEDELNYHVTAKFLGRTLDPEYQTAVHDFLEKLFYIHLVGIVFTPRTIGVRVKLTEAQQLIFDEKDTKRNCNTLSSTSSTCSEKLNVKQALMEELESYSKLKRMHKTNAKCKFKKDETKIAFRRLIPKSDKTANKHPSSSSGLNSDVIMTNSRAHITIACAPNVLPRLTGEDLVEIIDLEQRPVSVNVNFQQDFKIKGGTLRQFGRPAVAFVFYPKYEMIVPGVFNCV